MDTTRHKILHAAGQVFAEKGFEASSVREICAAAGVNLAAVNYHFRDKAGLYWECVKEAHCSRGVLPEFPVDADLSAEEQLAGFVRQMMEMMVEDDEAPWQFELAMREMARPTEACSELVRTFIGPMMDILMAIVGRLLPPSTSIEERRLFAFSVVGQCLLYRFHRAVGRLLMSAQDFDALLDADRLASHITSVMIPALRARGSAGQSAVDRVDRGALNEDSREPAGVAQAEFRKGDS